MTHLHRREFCLSMLATTYAASLSRSAAASATATSASRHRPAVVLTGASRRTHVDLSGVWTYSIDPTSAGLADYPDAEVPVGYRRFDPIDVEGHIARDARALFEYDMRRAPAISLPASWITHEPALRHYDGVVWHAREVEFRTDARQRCFLRFEAADYFSRVYLNGKFVGVHEGGFTPFSFEVTDLVRDGVNHLVVAVDSRRRSDSVPAPLIDWETYGGITRPVRLVTTPLTFIDDAWIGLSRDGHLSVHAQLNGRQSVGSRVQCSIPELGVTLNGTTDATGRWDTMIAAPPGLQRWSPDRPTLYQVSVTTDTDGWVDRIGFRTIEVQGDDILLNGMPVFLRGICLHEESIAPNPSRCLREADVQLLLNHVKYGLSGNFVRLAHYPHTELMTRLADELGLLVWSEIPIYWHIDWNSERTLNLARGMLAENILRDRNRASIVFWSIGNETPVSEPRNAFMSTLAADARALDGTRLITAALIHEQSYVDGRLEVKVDDPLVEHLDVMSVNTYNGWYDSIPLAAVPATVWKLGRRKPLILSEFGAGALARFHDPHTMRKFSEEYQAEYYRATLQMAMQMPSLRGMAPWVLKDFRSPRRQHPIYQRGWNRKGVLSETGEKKLAHGVLAEFYSRLAKS